MINTEHMLSTHELAQFSYRNLVDDRQDYIIETLNSVINSNENSIEEKVLALDKLGDIYWNYIGDLNKALKYTNMATLLADSTDISFSYILRGSIWENKLQLLELLGIESEVEVELNRIINEYGTKEFTSSSYLYNAYKYKADREYKKGNFKAALDYLMDAQSYYPVKFYANHLHEIQNSDYKNEFDNLEMLLSRNVCSIKDWQI